MPWLLPPSSESYQRICWWSRSKKDPVTETQLRFFLSCADLVASIHLVWFFPSFGPSFLRFFVLPLLLVFPSFLFLPPFQARQPLSTPHSTCPSSHLSHSGRSCKSPTTIASFSPGHVSLLSAQVPVSPPKLSTPCTFHGTAKRTPLKLG